MAAHFSRLSADAPPRLVVHSGRTPLSEVKKFDNALPCFIPFEAPQVKAGNYEMLPIFLKACFETITLDSLFYSLLLQQTTFSPQPQNRSKKANITINPSPISFSCPPSPTQILQPHTSYVPSNLPISHFRKDCNPSPHRPRCGPSS